MLAGGPVPLDMIDPYLDAGCIAVNLGGSLAVPDLVREQQWDEIGRRVLLATSIVESRRQVDAGRAMRSTCTDAADLWPCCLATAFPSTSRTSWMRPEARSISPSACPASRRDDRAGKVGAEAGQGRERGRRRLQRTTKSLTLEFRKDRLASIRFELFVFLPEIRLAFEEERASLAESLGKPRKATKSILIYDNALPNVMVVANDDPKSQQGKQGLGVLAVRYYDPR